MTVCATQARPTRLQVITQGVNTRLRVITQGVNTRLRVITQGVKSALQNRDVAQLLRLVSKPQGVGMARPSKLAQRVMLYAAVAALGGVVLGVTVGLFLALLLKR